MRDHLKSIQTREEGLDEDAEKKLSQMNPEHKNLGTQTELRNHLRGEIRTMDSDIMSEEAAVGISSARCRGCGSGSNSAGCLNAARRARCVYISRPSNTD